MGYNLFIASKIYLFAKGWIKKTITTVRWQFIQMAGRIIKHAGEIIVKISGILEEIYKIFKNSRERCVKLQYIL
ncbi:MAG: hypothetical protein QME68_03630 [Elusimicrobiota bacterium]|nr:hypothetical protein [Elusimicrobiota bacterium]